MSTRCNVAVKLRNEDKGKTFKTKSGEEFYVDKDANYLSIYIHHDGYINGVGKYLFDNIKTYEQALQYILEGDRTSFETSYVETGEHYDDNTPTQYYCNSIEQIPNEYFYLFYPTTIVDDFWIVGRYENNELVFEDLEVEFDFN